MAPPIPRTRAALRKLPGSTRTMKPSGRKAANDRLMIVKCADCRFHTHPPLPRCRNCGSARVTPTQMSGKGRVHCFTVNHQPWIPGLAVPYVVAMVELVEQPELYLLTNIIGCEIDQVTAGMKVAVVFEQDGPVHLPMFRPMTIQS